tara:strand:+ start:56008 stop:57066 length:1059 start_codon:yes stop_codon:yes gene_type:complete
MKIGKVKLESPFALAPMAGMTDTAFRRLVKERGGCGLVVTEMVSSEGLVRGIDRTLEYAEYTEEERPVSIQIFGGSPHTMSEAAKIVENMGADIVDVNMGCPVRKIAKHNAGCSLMKDPLHAAKVVRTMSKAVKIPVTVKMRAGWDDSQINAPFMARLMEDAGASAVAVHGRTAAQSYKGLSDWGLIDEVSHGVSIPVFGSGDCVTADQLITKMSKTEVSGILVGRGALRNPWIFRQTMNLDSGVDPYMVTEKDRGEFLLKYIDMLVNEGVDECAGFRHRVANNERFSFPSTKGRERWVVNKLRALASWYTKGFQGGASLRMSINQAQSIQELRDLVQRFFLEPNPVESLLP